MAQGQGQGFTTPIKGKGTPAGPGGAARPYAGGAPAAGGRPTKDEQTAVMLMQKLLGTLASELDNNAKAASEKLKADEGKVKGWARNIVLTSQGTGTPFDGKWGTNTINSLKTAAELAKTMETAVINPGISFRKRDPNDVVTDANKNSDALRELMGKLDLAVPADLAGKAAKYDFLPGTLTEENIDPRVAQEGRFVMEAKDLSTLVDAYVFLQSLYGLGKPGIAPAAAYSREAFLKKLAKEIKDSLIIRTAQGVTYDREALMRREQAAEADRKRREQAKADAESTAAAGREATRRGDEAGRQAQYQKGYEAGQRKQQTAQQQAKPEQPKETEETKKKKEQAAAKGLLTVEQVTNGLSWVARRARMMYLVANHAVRTKSKNPNPVTGKPYTAADVQTANQYYRAAHNVYRAWTSQRRRFLKKGDLDGKNSYVDPIELEGGEIGAARPYGYGYGYGQGPYGGTPIDFGTDTVSLNPPLQNFIPNIIDLARQYGIGHRVFGKMQHGTMNISNWSSYPPQDFLPRYFRERMNARDEIAWSLYLVQALQTIMTQIYSKWTQRVTPHLRDQTYGAKFRAAMQAEEDILNEWQRVLGDVEHKIRKFWMPRVGEKKTVKPRRRSR